MGQRHQIYARLDMINGEKETVGIHHQWLYGRIACVQALRLATLWSNMNEISRKHFDSNDLKQMLAGVYSTIPEEGYFHRVHSLENGECEDPRRGDNNDGITIFDLNAKGGAFCMMSLDGLEGESKALEPLRPLSIAQYVRSYYPKDGEWTKRTTPQEVNETEKEIYKIILRSRKLRPLFPLLTLDRCREIFPAMYEPAKI